MKPTKNSVTILVNNETIALYRDKVYRVGVNRKPELRKNIQLSRETFYEQTMMDVKKISKNADVTIDYIVEM